MTRLLATSPRRSARRPLKWIVAALLVAIAATLPLIHGTLPFVFEGPLDSPGVLHLLAVMLTFGALAITYDLLFGFTGLLSFGHSLYFAVGVYGTVVVLSTTHLGLAGVIVIVAVCGLVLPLLIGWVCLRVKDIAFAMVTLAFAQGGTIFVMRDPLNITGGELGKALPFNDLPAAFVGVFNTKNLYWLALGLVVAVYLVSRVATRSTTGRVWQGIRENESRIEVLGLSPTRYKLAVFVLASFLATICGVVYVLVVGGAHPTVTTPMFTLTLLVMAVLGGVGRLWGALIGGLLYTYLDHRLGQLSTSPGVEALPDWMQVPLSEPLFLLGLLFVLVVLYLPGGIAGLITGSNGRPAVLRSLAASMRGRRRRRPTQPPDAPELEIDDKVPAEPFVAAGTTMSEEMRQQ